uniref:Uncharacterized protein n=1 Tax=Arundo donax TaxID=35708 RepID=A0A0A9DZ28_ARUDO
MRDGEKRSTFRSATDERGRNGNGAT